MKTSSSIDVYMYTTTSGERHGVGLEDGVEENRGQARRGDGWRLSLIHI